MGKRGSGVTVDLRAINRSHNLLIVDDTSYVCGGDGTEGVVLKTTNSGQTWVHQSVNPGHPIAAVDFPVNDQTGFAAGWAGVLLKTTDGGAHWDSLSSGTTSDLVGICFPGDTLTGYVVGSGGTVLKTTDGGATWVSEPTGVGDYFASVSFPTSSTGYVCGASGTILKTTDGGSTWVKQVSGTSYFLTAIQFFVDAQTGYAVGRNGVILKTTDGGAGVEETPNGDVRTTNAGPTVVRGVLFLLANGEGRVAHCPTGASEAKGELLNVSGRKVLDLHPGGMMCMPWPPGSASSSTSPKAQAAGRKLSARSS